MIAHRRARSAWRAAACMTPTVLGHCTILRPHKTQNNSMKTTPRKRTRSRAETRLLLRGVPPPAWAHLTISEPCTSILAAFEPIRCQTRHTVALQDLGALCHSSIGHQASLLENSSRSRNLIISILQVIFSLQRINGDACMCFRSAKYCALPSFLQQSATIDDTTTRSSLIHEYKRVVQGCKDFAPLHRTFQPHYPYQHPHKI